MHLQKNLKKGNNYDALNEEWSNKIIWAIIPFSHLRPFILMLPTNQMIQKDIYEKYLEKIVERKTIGEVALIHNGVPMSKVYAREISLGYFMQSSFLQDRSDMMQ